MSTRAWNIKPLPPSIALSLSFLTGCISLDLDIPDLLPTIGTSFVVKGESVILEGDSPCPAWIGDNGVTYHLFQDPNVSNEAFDEVMTPGVRSRLQIVPRSDLVLTCSVGTLVEVQDILEIE